MRSFERLKPSAVRSRMMQLPVSRIGGDLYPSIVHQQTLTLAHRFFGGQWKAGSCDNLVQRWDCRRVSPITERSQEWRRVSGLTDRSVPSSVVALLSL